MLAALLLVSFAGWMVVGSALRSAPGAARNGAAREDRGASAARATAAIQPIDLADNALDDERRGDIDEAEADDEVDDLVPCEAAAIVPAPRSWLSEELFGTGATSIRASSGHAHGIQRPPRQLLLADEQNA